MKESSIVGIFLIGAYAMMPFALFFGFIASRHGFFELNEDDLRGNAEKPAAVEYQPASAPARKDFVEARESFQEMERCFDVARERMTMTFRSTSSGSGHRVSSDFRVRFNCH